MSVPYRVKGTQDSGIYLRVERDGEWQSVAIEMMSGEEIAAAMERRGPEELTRWIVALASALLAAQEKRAFFAGVAAGWRDRFEALAFENEIRAVKEADRGLTDMLHGTEEP